MNSAAYCTIPLVAAAVLMGSALNGWGADETKPASPKMTPGADSVPQKSAPEIPGRELIRRNTTPSIGRDTPPEKDAQFEMCSSLFRDARTTIDSMRRNCASTPASRFVFTTNVQDLKTNHLNWEKNRCAESALPFQHKIAYETIHTSEFDEVEGMCRDGCWSALQGRVAEGSLRAFLRQCSECCGFYPLDSVQRCRNECNRLEEERKEVEGDLQRLMDQLSEGITAIMKMLDTVIKTNEQLN